MNGIVLSLDTREGTYQVGCLVPSPHNREPLSPAVLGNRYSQLSPQERVRVRPLVINAIQATVLDEDDDSGVPDVYTVIALPVPGSQYEREGLGVYIQITSDEVLRPYFGAAIPVVAQAAESVLNPTDDAEDEEDSEEDDSDSDDAQPVVAGTSPASEPTEGINAGKVRTEGQQA